MTQHMVGGGWTERLGGERTKGLDGGIIACLRNGVVSLLAALLCAGVARAEPFEIELGDTISPGVPGAGAGSIETAGTTDTYTFVAEAGQIVFEEFAVDPSFSGWLRWEVKTPAGQTLFARPDWFAVEPGGSIAIPRQKFLCNDAWDTADSSVVSKRPWRPSGSRRVPATVPTW